MIIDLVKYLVVAMSLFLLGIWGIFLNRKNIIVMLMSIELMLLAVNLNFIILPMLGVLKCYNNNVDNKKCYWWNQHEEPK